jgi:hypothetical protein
MAFIRCVARLWVLLALASAPLPAAAQGLPVPPGSVPGGGGGSNPVCQRLEAQLAALERGQLDPARAAHLRRYEDALRRQQGELDRVVMHSRRLGCQGGGFFSLFSGQPEECPALNRQIQQMHANIDRMMMEMRQIQGGAADRESERRAILVALGRNDCGPHYRAATAPPPRGFFESLFGPGFVSPAPPAPDMLQSSTYRTLCVRTCDGYYFPISFAASPSRFAEDERTCQRLCPAAETVLFTHRNPGEDINQATSLNGRLYTELPNAFLYRREYNPACSCKRAGETWAQALQHLDDTIQQGDIVVTDERARQLSQPREMRPSPGQARPEPRGQPAPGGTAAPAPATSPGQVRTVGPPFLPRQ